MPNESRPAVFLDRDGTIMRDVEYCGEPKDVHVFNGAAEALQRLKDAGFKLIVITNQSGIGRGYFSERAYRAVEAEVQRQLPMIDATYFCPHQPNEDCACRKPKPQMIVDAQREHQLDLSRSWFLGDKELDAECGRNAGVQSILVRTGRELPKETSVADLAEAVDVILRNAR
jgi:histidinol-phosphate phosphatase family protein